MTASAAPSLRETDDAFGSAAARAVLSLTEIGLEVIDPASPSSLVFYFSRSGEGDQKILAFAQAVIAELTSEGGTK